MYFFLFTKLLIALSLPRLARAADTDAVALGSEPNGELDITLGVTTAGEPGPRSMRLSSVASANICEDRDTFETEMNVNMQCKIMGNCFTYQLKTASFSSFAQVSNDLKVIIFDSTQIGPFKPVVYISICGLETLQKNRG